MVFIPKNKKKGNKKKGNKKKGNGLQKKKISCKKTVKKNTGYYCPMEGVTYACPETCGLCDSNEPS